MNKKAIVAILSVIAMLSVVIAGLLLYLRWEKEAREPTCSNAESHLSSLLSSKERSDRALLGRGPWANPCHDEKLSKTVLTCMMDATYEKEFWECKDK